MDGTTHVILNVLLTGGFAVTAYETFKNHSPWAAVSMAVSLGMIMFINGV